MADPTDLGERALSAAQNIIRRGQEVAKRETRVLKLQTRISRLRSQRQQLFAQMGHKVYDLFQRDLVRNQELRMTCQQIRAVEAEIEMSREEIEQLRRPDTRDEQGVDDTDREAADGIDDEIMPD